MSLATRIRQLGRLPAQALRLLVHGPSLLDGIRSALARQQRLSADLADRIRMVEKYTGRTIPKRLEHLDEGVREVRDEMRERLTAINLRLSQASSGGPSAPRSGRSSALSGGGAIPLTVEGPGPGWRRPADGAPHPDPDGREWLLLDHCPYCGHRERTLVLEWNKLILIEVAPDDTSARYDYSLCHGCGVVYAARRPTGRRFTYLLEHFGEVTAKQGGGAAIANPLLNPYPLSEADRDQLTRMAEQGIFVSEHRGLRKTDYLEGLVKDRFENSVHVDLLGMLVAPRGARVLELRPRAGTIAESLRRLFDARVTVVPMWESQRFLLKAVYGFDSTGLVDFDHFQVPAGGPYDLIIGNHMLTHMLRPDEFLRELRENLAPGGYVYFYNEPQDLEYLEGGQSVIAHLNPLHVHSFDQAALTRMLAANGFETVFVKGRYQNHLCLARQVDAAPWLPMSQDERAERLSDLRRARDRAVLKAPEAFRGRFAGEWTAAIERALGAGDIEFDPKGQLRFVAPRMRGPKRRSLFDEEG